MKILKHKIYIEIGHVHHAHHTHHHVVITVKQHVRLAPFL